MGLRVGMSMALALLGLLVLAVPTSAGGFAVTTFDQLPTTMRADETYQLGYTVRQHGVTPLPAIATRIVAQRAATGETMAFVGTPYGEPGHYVAQVRFPDPGVWLWRVEQGPFAPQQLGSVSVAGGPSGAPDAERATIAGRLSALPAAGVLLPLATVLASVLFARRLALALRGRPAGLDRRLAAGAWRSS